MLLNYISCRVHFASKIHAIFIVGSGMFASIRTLSISAILSAILCLPLHAQSGADGILIAARTIYESAASKDEANRRAEYSSVRQLLDLVLEQHPGSDAALGIMLEETVAGIDVAELNRALAAQAQTDESPSTAASVDAETTTAEQSVTVEAALVPARPEKEVVKDIQTELNRVGCSAGTADGVAGRKTRSAFEDFLFYSGTALSLEDLATEAAVSALQGTLDPVCTSRWLAANAPDKLAGTWGYRADCKMLFGKARITGAMRLGMNAPGKYQGPISNSLGENGTIYATVSGNAVNTQINWPRQKTTSQLYTSTRSTSLSGKDSNNCDVVAWRN
ncbi:MULTISPECIES: peptidoglycan-binding domain-containing protein [unclassified Ruegeria]|uniref:peptidoglycan-binding domain-containing protein n=1 Tax=unclassified Ruegeria TaxID=2625375 RepID=UPI001AE9BCB8|nr:MULTISPECIES: peptidoglycan-binding domain-containing protein [unclassified Ruegeria]